MATISVKALDLISARLDSPCALSSFYPACPIPEDTAACMVKLIRGKLDTVEDATRLAGCSSAISIDTLLDVIACTATLLDRFIDSTSKDPEYDFDEGRLTPAQSIVVKALLKSPLDILGNKRSAIDAYMDFTHEGFKEAVDFVEAIMPRITSKHDFLRS